MATHTLFYSWQSDLPNSTNRGFIEDCLERAVKEVRADEELTLDPCLDRDTIGVPGSPDIAATIFEKISGANVFVADVSFIAQSATGRRCPNPNVLIELGYAARCLGWEKIICVFNRATGRIDELPFDLRPRRVRAYELLEGQEKAEQRKLMVGMLRADVTGILHAPDKAEAEERSRLMSSITSAIIPIIIAGDESNERMMAPWADGLRVRFRSVAENLRNLAASDTAMRNDIADDLDGLATALDDAANLRMVAGMWPQFQQLVETALKKAAAIKETHIDGSPLSADSLMEAKDIIVSTQRQLAGLAIRADDMAKRGRHNDLKNQSSQFGYSLLRISHYNIDPIQPGIAQKVRLVGRDLHLMETMRVYGDGGRSVQAIIDRLLKNVAALTDLAQSLG